MRRPWLVPLTSASRVQYRCKCIYQGFLCQAFIVESELKQDNLSSSVLASWFPLTVLLPSTLANYLGLVTVSSSGLSLSRLSLRSTDPSYPISIGGR